MFERYQEWKRNWVEASRCTPNLRVFVCEQLLPFYPNCSKCGKFRKLEFDETFLLSTAFLETYNCDNCLDPEDSSVGEAKKITFIQSVSAPPLLHDAPAVHYLRGEYYLDEVGFSPVNARFFIDDCPTKGFMSPFNMPTEQSMAFSVRPDIMEYDEVHAFPEYANEAVPYLAMRNSIIGLWNLDPFVSF